MASDDSPEQERRMRHALEAQQRFGPDLLRRGGVHTIAIGFKRSGGQDSDEIAVLAFVSKKRPPEEVGDQLIPPRLVFYSVHDREDVTVLTDVREASPPKPLAHVSDDLTARVRPVPGGYSLGYWGTSAGTLGGWVWESDSNSIVLLSNEHVIGSITGTKVLQPGVADGGAAQVDAFAATIKTAATYDASVALANDPADIAMRIIGSGPAVLELTDPVLGMLVEKTGRTTKHTLGKIVATNSMFIPPGGVVGDTFVEPDPPGANFVEGGDSGSLLLERVHPQERTWKRVVGLIWGGASTEHGNGAWVHPISAVFNELHLKPVCAGLFEALLEGLGSSGDATEASGGGKGKGGGVGAGTGQSSRAGERPAAGRRARTGLGRDLQRRIAATPVGSLVVEALSEHRDAAVELLLDGDGRRAIEQLVTPFLAGSVTTDEILARALGDEDVRNAERLLVVVERLRPDKRELVEQARRLARGAAGRTLSEFLALERES